MTEDGRGDDGNHGGKPENGNPAVEHARRHHLVYSVFFSLLFTLLDFIFVWPESHFWALLAAWGAISAVAWAELPRVFAIMASAGAAVAAFAIYVYAPQAPDSVEFPPVTKLELREIPDTEVIGTLKPGDLPTPPNGCDSHNVVHGILVLIGDNAVTNLSGPVTPLQIGTCKVVTVTPSNDGVLIDADLYDAAGNRIAQIEKNNFVGINGSHSTVTREGNLNTLVVKDSSGNELLYVSYMNRTTVRIRGTFGCAGHTSVRVEDERPVPGVLMTDSCYANNGGVGISIQ